MKTSLNPAFPAGGKVPQMLTQVAIPKPSETQSEEIIHTNDHVVSQLVNHSQFYRGTRSLQPFVVDRFRCKG
jgi:hypothetical protein